jgi:hypothetical protein
LSARTLRARAELALYRDACMGECGARQARALVGGEGRPLRRRTQGRTDPGVRSHYESPCRPGAGGTGSPTFVCPRWKMTTNGRR